MNSYKISHDFSFLEMVAKSIIDKFGDQDLRKRLIILPNNLACIELQKILTLKYKIIVLPTILPFAAIISEKKDTQENYKAITTLEEKLIITEIISNYDKLKFSVNEALNAAELLSKLFNELISNNIAIHSIETYNNSKYWQTIYKFLEYGFEQWQTKITETGKQSRAAYKLAILEEEITKIKDTNRDVIIAGLFATDPIIKKFLEELAPLPSVSIINPEVSFPSSTISTASIYSAEPLNIYEEAEQVALICQKNAHKKIAIIVNNQKAKEIYCNFLLKYSLVQLNSKSFRQDEFKEESAQRTIVREHRRRPKNSLVSSFLNDAVFNDLLGNDLATTNISQILITITKILCNDFDLKTLFLLLKNPLIISPDIQKLEIILLNKNRFISSSSHLLLIVEATTDEELIAYCRELINILYGVKVYTSQDILKTTREIAEKLYPNIWQEEGGAEILEFLDNLANFSQYISLKRKQDFPRLLFSLISNMRYFNNNDEANILIGTAEDLALLKFDLVLLPNFNDENWPPPVPIHPWLSKEAKKQLKIDYEEISSTLSLYYFYLFLNNKQVIILRAKKQNGKSTIPSNFFLKLQLILGENLRPLESIKSLDSRLRGNDITSYSGAYSNNFPEILSVTDTETLIRSPYSFYAKKILNLRKKDMIWEEPKIADFGNFIHKVLEKYSKNYAQYGDHDIKEKQQNLINIGNNILQNISLPGYTKKTWQIKLLPIAKAFILFDDERRKNCQNIYFELKGELQLNIAGQNIKIIGIADRIEINYLNQITILDYKTGAIPTKKEIESGLSPQLIIEALMILENGFIINAPQDDIYSNDPLNWNVKQGVSTRSLDRLGEHANPPKFCRANLEEQKSVTIAYVKISSSAPYIELTEIKLNQENLKHYKQGLISLLEHYITNKFFPYNIDLSKYNDYLHLKRMI
ncbi:palindromic element RPE3 domain-containing protein [Rickettsia endosymbiont of Halotydeus destructor]|uniref:palindromic element RPE3 domain-containing protein n=1 Tax=Rickettsia endosymbiont of Halotydeus destructor TaxID=2996754 RepID=UPI003BAEABEF